MMDIRFMHDRLFTPASQGAILVIAQVGFAGLGTYNRLGVKRATPLFPPLEITRSSLSTPNNLNAFNAVKLAVARNNPDAEPFCRSKNKPVVQLVKINAFRDS